MEKIILLEFFVRSNAIRCLHFSSPMVKWNRRLSYSLRTTNLLLQIVICIFYEQKRTSLSTDSTDTNAVNIFHISFSLHTQVMHVNQFHTYIIHNILHL